MYWKVRRHCGIVISSCSVRRFLFIKKENKAMETVPEFFGSKVFDDRVMKARLSADVYNSLKKTIQEGSELDLSVANAVASAMCTWAVENGATHFTH